MSSKTNRVYGTSILSLIAGNGLSKILTRTALVAAIDLARQHDLRLQLLPLNQWVFGTTHALGMLQPDEVISYEDRWGHPVSHACLELFKRRQPKAALAALLFFMGDHSNNRLVAAMRQQFPDAVAVDVGSYGAVEPGINKNHSWLAWDASHRQLVIDTHHLREFTVLKHRELLGWIQTRLGRSQVDLIHLQFRSESEMNQYLAGEGDTYDIMMLFVDTTIPVVIELDDTVASLKNILRLRDATRGFIG